MFNLTPLRFDMDAPPLAAAPPPPAPPRVIEAAGVTIDSDDEAGWTRLSGHGMGSGNSRDLTPMSQERMQKLAEFLWQSNALANRLIEIPLAYLLAEGVKLTCTDEAHQKLLAQFWDDPINAWPLKLMPRARDLSLLGEQCYRVFSNVFDGAVRLGYVDPRQIGLVVTDPDNAEQPIGVITRKDARGNYKKYRVIVLGPEEAFSNRTIQIRADFKDGDVFLFQVNKLATGSRGRSDILAQMDWLDAYDEFLFGELDRARYLRAFVWDLNVKNATPEDIQVKQATFKPPAPNSVYIHNDGEALEAKSAGLQAADSSHFARLFRNHVLAGSTIPEHWFGGGGDVNRAAASEMGEPTFKMLTARQTVLKQMLETIGRYVLASQKGATPDWGDDKWRVTAEFPELVSKDVTKFASAMREVATACILLMDKGLITDERALRMVADIAARFGQVIDAKQELEDARKQFKERQAENEDAFSTPPGAGDGEGGTPPGQPSARQAAAQAKAPAQAAA